VKITENVSFAADPDHLHRRALASGQDLLSEELKVAVQEPTFLSFLFSNLLLS